MSLYKLFLENLKHNNPNIITCQFGSHENDEHIGYLSNSLIGRSAAAISCGGPGEPTFSEVQSWYKNWNFEGKLKNAICERNAFMEINGMENNVIPIEALYNVYQDDIFKCGCVKDNNSHFIFNNNYTMNISIVP